MLRVLTYHRIADGGSEPDLCPSLISATPKRFAEHAAYLAAHYQVVSIHDVLRAAGNGSRLPDRAVLLTFDDAYRDFAQHAWPVLKQYGLPATLFVPTGYADGAAGEFWWDRLYRVIHQTGETEVRIPGFGALSFRSTEERQSSLRTVSGYVKSLPHQRAMTFVNALCRRLGMAEAQPSPVLNWGELRRLAQEGLSLGAHTQTHPLLGQLPPEQVREQVEGAQRALLRETGSALPIFAYPGGSLNAVVVRILREAGIQLAFTTRDGHNDLRRADLLRLCRTNVTRKTSTNILRLRLLRVTTYFDRWRHERQSRQPKKIAKQSTKAPAAMPAVLVLLVSSLGCWAESSRMAPSNPARPGAISQSLPGDWRPFSANSPWNQPIGKNAKTHADSEAIMGLMASEAENLRFARQYTIPVWVVASDALPQVKVRSDRIFDTWDTDRDGWSDIGAPLTPEMWAEGSEDGHLSVIDPGKSLAWEFSKFKWTEEGTPRCTTFNVWDLKGLGVADVNEGRRWQMRGGRGSGFPLIAGLVRPEELAAGEIRHALVFTFSKNRDAEGGGQIFMPPASRSDGKYFGREYPIEGMRLQLDPTLTEEDFDGWKLNREGKILARALQKYGMFVGDNGGAMAVQLQLLSRDPREHKQKWEARFPGIYREIEKIPTHKFRVVETTRPIVKRRSAHQDGAH